jgi:dTDP-glucose pyrophosphorylase
MNYLNIESLIIDAMEVIELSKRSIAVVVDNRKVLGTISDGDIRRAFLSGLDKLTPACQIMNKNPVIVCNGTPDNKIHDILVSNNIDALPIVDENNNFLRVFHISDVDPQNSSLDFLSNAGIGALILAGGKGTRLMPHTRDLPKPMVTVGNIPIIERQVLQLRAFGVVNIYISINYLGNIIKEYFQSGEAWSVNIEYLEEDSSYGTAGPLSLMPYYKNILMINGDILTDVNYNALFSYHISHNAAMTVAAIGHQVNIPYGVLEIDQNILKSIQEKPSQRFQCNAGIYMLSYDILRFVPKASYFDVTHLIEKLMLNNILITVFPIYENWIDIGTPEQLKLARSIY